MQIMLTPCPFNYRRKSSKPVAGLPVTVISELPFRTILKGPPRDQLLLATALQAIVLHINLDDTRRLGTLMTFRHLLMSR